MKLVVRHDHARVAGFSLVELMIVVAILGVLGTIVTKQYRTMTAKARRAEAFKNLSLISTMQESYAGENGNYFGLFVATMAPDPLSTNDISTASSCNNNNALGFNLGDCRKARYVYSTVARPSSPPVVNADFRGFAVEMVPPGGARRVNPGCTPPPFGFGFMVCPADAYFQRQCELEHSLRSQRLDMMSITSVNSNPFGSRVRQVIDAVADCR
jgi:prepilin-type N-terminal cleavage/methylation domain-containing protein